MELINNIHYFLLNHFSKFVINILYYFQYHLLNKNILWNYNKSFVGLEEEILYKIFVLFKTF
jgi:hypothetical protein